MKIYHKPFSLIIIQVYALTEKCTEEEVDQFYEDLEKAKKICKNQEMVFIMGDLNAKVGREKFENTVGEYGLGIRHPRGEKWIEWCKINNQVITNTFYKHHTRRVWTWQSPDKKIKNQINFITINERFKNSVLNATTFPGADCNSDHNSVICDQYY